MKRFVSYLLSVAILITSISLIFPINANAVSESTVKKSLDSIVSQYPAGTSWNGSFDGGIQCFGFGRMVIYKIFGKTGSGAYRHWNYAGTNLTGMTAIGSITSFSSNNVKSLLSNARPGDILQFNTTKQHTMIVYSVDSDGVYIYDCNWNGKCGIRLTKCSFDAWSGRNSTKLSLLRADNYDNATTSNGLSKLDEGILSIVNDNKNSFISDYNYYKQYASAQTKTVKQVIDGIAIAEMTGGMAVDAIKLCFNLGTANVSGTIEDSVSLALSLGVRAFKNVICIYSVAYGEAYIEMGLEMLQEMKSLIENNCNKNGKITDPNVARKIYALRLNGVDYLLHGTGYYTPYYNDLISRGSTIGIMKDGLQEAFIQEFTGSAVELALKSAGLSLDFDDLYSALITFCDSGFFTITDLLDMVRCSSEYPLHTAQISNTLSRFNNTYKNNDSISISAITASSIGYGSLLYSSDTFYNSNSIKEIGQYKVTTPAGLNCRRKPNATSDKISFLKTGSIVEVMATNGNWGEVPGYGWICLDYCEYQGEIVSSYDEIVFRETGYYIVNTNAGLNIRIGPATSYYVITAVKNNTELRITKTSGNWGYCPEYDGWCYLGYTYYSRELEPELPVPEMPIITLTVNADMAVGSYISAKWNPVAFATSYDVRLVNALSGKTIKEVKDISAATYSFAMENAGEYKISVSAKNSQHIGEAGVSTTVTAHSNCKVRFVDYDGSIISEQTVPFQNAAVAPVNPNRYGYVFTGWSTSFSNIEKDTTITAQYDKKVFTVKFYDYDGTLVDNQDVKFEEAAKQPKYQVPSGYSLVGWNKDFSCVTGDMDITAIVSWTSQYPLEISTTSAVERNNSTYIFSTIINNSPYAVSNAKVVAVLKTAENKQLATVVSGNFSIAAGGKKTLSLTADYDGASTVADIFVVNNSDEWIPLAGKLRVSVNQGTAWSQWSTSNPPSNALQTENRTEYRYRDKSYTTSSSSSLSGWTKYNTTSAYSAWGSTQGPVYSDPGSSDLRNSWSEPYTSGYGTTHWYHYFRYANSAGTSGNDYKTSTCTNYEQIDITYPLTVQSSTKGGSSGQYGYKVFYNNSNYNTQSGNYKTYWYLSETDETDYNKPITGTRWYYQDRTLNYTYYYYKWSDFSSWSTNKTTATSDREVETRKTYRYISNIPANIEDKTGSKRTVSGTVGSSFANKQAIIKIISADGAVQFIDQCKLDANGSYNFSYKLKSEPSIESGDYTVALLIEGTSSAISLAPIEAPKPTYIVTFRDMDGTTISRQTVNKYGKAIVPTPIEHEGFTFEKWSADTSCVTEDITVNAIYSVNSFDIVFIDDLQETSIVKTFNYGDTIVAPTITAPEGYTFIGWDAVLGGKTTVTGSMVIKAVYEKNSYSIQYTDFDGNVIKSAEIEYGDAIEDAVLENDGSKEFLDWVKPSDTGLVTEDMVINPYFIYQDTVATPSANIETGTYNTKQTVTLSCDTTGAKIYYRTDGGDPLEINNAKTATKSSASSSNYTGTLYTGPINLEKSANLVYAAVKDEMNNSTCDSELLAINTGLADKKYTVSIHYNIIGDHTIIVDGNKILPASEYITGLYGYTLNGVYKDAAHTQPWDLKTDKITSSLDLYFDFSKNTYEVSFFDVDNDIIETQTIPYLESAVPPIIDDNIPGKLFIGWDTSFDNIRGNSDIKPVYIEEDEITRIELNKTELSLMVDATSSITASVLSGKDSNNKNIEWHSNNEDVAIVDDNGLVKAIGFGSAMIYATSEDSGETAFCSVNVECNHNYLSVVTSPDCTQKGYTTFTCSVCKNSYIDNYVNATGHNYVETERIPATCTEDGVIVRTCAVCEETQTEKLAKTNHYDNDVDGYCDYCGTELNSHQTTCSHLCHKTGFMGFIWKIINLFNRLFKINQYCECGAKHW